MVNYQQTLSVLGIPLALFILVVIWSAVWKLLALWRAARNKSVAWFIVLGIVNTMGILEILYLFVFSKLKRKNKKQNLSKTKTKIRK